MPPNHVWCVAELDARHLLKLALIGTRGSGMIRLILLISTSRSSPAISTPKLNAVRIVIRMPNSRNATKIDSSVKMVRIFRRQTLLPDERAGNLHRQSPPQRATPFSRCSVRVGALGGVRVVRDHHDRLAVLAVERLQQVEDFVARLAIEIARRLVAEQQRRVGDDGARDADALLLAARELARIVLARGRRGRRPSARSRRACAARPSTRLVSSSGSSTLRSAVSTGSRL